MAFGRSWVLSCVAVASLGTLGGAGGSMLVSGAARADLAPPIIVPHPAAVDPVPAEIKLAVLALTKAIENSDEAAFKSYCDPRGWETNLIGGSGGTVRSVYAQGARKRWGLVRHGATTVVGAREGFIVPMDVKAFDGGKVLDQLFVLFAKVDGAWRVLGAGETLSDVRALGKRFVAGAPLAPPEDPTPPTTPTTPHGDKP